MSMVRCIRVSLIAVCALLALGLRDNGPRAQTGDAAKSLIGTWEISNADRDKTCTITFKGDAAGTAFKLELDKACVPNLPMMKDVSLWKIGPEDAVQLLDARGRILVEFTEVENNMYNTERPNEGVFFLQPPGQAGPPARTVEEMMGDWNIVRGNKPICGVTLSNTPTGLDYVLKVKPGCDAFVTRFGPAAWAMDRSELLLKSPRGINWRFEEGDDNKWQRVPESADPLLLVRP
jgi:protease inhibitor Inh